jgi:hypothetical protein
MKQRQELFFFEKKNQKTFVGCGSAFGPAAPRKQGKSLFASFSSEKEDILFCFFLIRQNGNP